MRTMVSGNILSMQIEPVDVLAIRDMGEVPARIGPALRAILEAQDGVGGTWRGMATPAAAVPLGEATAPRDAEGPKAAL